MQKPPCAAQIATIYSSLYIPFQNQPNLHLKKITNLYLKVKKKLYQKSFTDFQTHSEVKKSLEFFWQYSFNWGRIYRKSNFFRDGEK